MRLIFLTIILSPSLLGVRMLPAQGVANRLRSIDTPSAVDQFERSVRQPGMPRASGNIRLTQFDFPAEGQSPPDSRPLTTAPPMGTPPTDAMPPAGTTAPPRTSPPISQRTLPPAMPPTVSSPSDQMRGENFSRGDNYLRGDAAPISPPRLNASGFATLDNCPNVSAPSRYSAASGMGCGAPAFTTPAFTAPAFTAPAMVGQSAVVNPPVVIGPGPTPTTPGFSGMTAVPGYTPPSPLFTLGQERNPVAVGQGLIGQPVAYVPGQSLRNFVRYFFP